MTPLPDADRVRDGLEITSTSNPRIKFLVTMRRRRDRDRAGITLVEGAEEIRLALAAGVRPQGLYYCPELVADGTGTLAEQIAGLGAEIFRVSRPVFAKIAYRESPDGWLAVVPAVGTDLARIDLGERPLVVICEGVEKPGNLGAILRTADAAGVSAVVAADPVTDWGNPNVVRASKGTVFAVPVASAGSPEILRWLAERSLTLVASTPASDVLMTEVDMTVPVAIAVGSEKHGLPAHWLAHASATVRIPMFGRADSLNVASSAAILTYEAVRQRMLRGLTPPRR
jgi:TrmH family RNA methyltransferase